MLFMFCHLARFWSLSVVFFYSLKFNHVSGSLLQPVLWLLVYNVVSIKVFIPFEWLQ